MFKDCWDEAAIFLSTPSARRATYRDNAADDVVGFLSTPSARRATMAHARLLRSG